MVDITVTTYNDKLILDLDDYDMEDSVAIVHNTVREMYSNSTEGWVQLMSEFARVRKMYPNASYVMRYGETGTKL